MFFEGILLKDALRNVTIILWQSLSPVSVVLVSQKDLGLFVSIILNKVPFKVLKHVLEFTLLVKGKVSMNSLRYLFVSIFILLSEKSMLRSPVTRILSYLFTALLRVLETSLKNFSLLPSIESLYANMMNHFFPPPNLFLSLLNGGIW